MEEVQKPQLLKLEHLGLVSGVAKDIGFVEKIDSLLGEKKSYNANVSFGESVLAMVDYSSLSGAPIPFQMLH